MGDQSLPSSIREREKILSSCLRSSLLTIESPYFEQATLLLEKHGAGRSAATCTRSWSSLERRRRAGSRGTGRGASAWRKQQHGAAESHRHSQPVDRCPVRRGGRRHLFREHPPQPLLSGERVRQERGGLELDYRGSPGFLAPESRGGETDELSLAEARPSEFGESKPIGRWERTINK